MARGAQQCKQAQRCMESTAAQSGPQLVWQLAAPHQRTSGTPSTPACAHMWAAFQSSALREHNSCPGLAQHAPAPRDMRSCWPFTSTRSSPSTCTIEGWFHRQRIKGSSKAIKCREATPQGPGMCYKGSCAPALLHCRPCWPRNTRHVLATHCQPCSSAPHLLGDALPKGADARQAARPAQEIQGHPVQQPRAA